MGVDLEVYRSAIGNFNNKIQALRLKYKILVKLFSSAFLKRISFSMLTFFRSFNIYIKCILPCILNIEFSVIALLLVIMSGDVQENPGPDLNTSAEHESLSVIHLNIRSIRNKLNYIKDSLLDFNILCFTETHLNHAILNEDLFLEGFQPIKFRKDVSAHSAGLLTYVSEGLIAAHRPDLEVDLDESLWIEVRHKGEPYLICNIYRPPSTPASFWQRLNIIIEKALESSKRLIIVGDLNEDQLNEHNRYLKDLININNLENIIKEPTRVTPLTATLLDVVIVSEDVDVLNSGTLQVDPSVSDHSAVYMFISFSYSHETSFKREVWNYKMGDYEKLNDLISSTDWSFINNGNLDLVCEQFTTKFMNLVRECVPSKTVLIRPTDKPWYDSVIRSTSRKRDRLKRKALKSGIISDWSKYKQIRNKVNNQIKHAKERFYNNIENSLIDSSSTDPKLYWKLLKHFMKNNKKSEIIPPLKTTSENGDESYAFNDLEKANALNDYFVSISKLDESNTSLPTFTPKTPHNLSDIRIEETEIADVINTLITNKACGEDQISHFLLKKTCSTIVKPLCLLFNRSHNECHFPSPWKSGRVMPLYKKGPAELPSNYRPISLLSCVGKIDERIVFKHMYNFFHTNNLIYKNQSGFLPGHSTVYQLLDIYHQITQSIDAKQHTCIVFCDVSKAFDRVWHKGLLFKLRQHGINGNLLQWISHYLSNRQQRVFIGSSISSPKFTTAGVPQGTVLGPLFFLIYINDIAESLLSIVRLFADDTSMACTSSNTQAIEGILNHDFAVLAAWAKQWLVDFHPLKTEAILFTSSNEVQNLNLIFDNILINFVENHKHLGLILSSNAKWHEHIENISSSVSKILGIMRSIKFRLTRKALNNVYISYVRPILEYASVVWDGCTAYEKTRLEQIQYEAARIVTGLTRSVSVNKLIKEIGWLPLSERRLFQKVVLMYKIKNDIAPEYVCNLMPPTVANRTVYNLRNVEDISVLNRRTEIFSRSFIPSTITYWNSIPLSIRNADSINSFKSQLKTSIFKVPRVPQQFLTGNRVFSIYHCRIRNNCSNLNNDLFRNHLRPNATCEWDFEIEDAEHYFFKCTEFEEQRIRLFQTTRKYHPLNLQLLLHGSDDLSAAENEELFSYIHNYIKETHRFSR